MSINNIEIQDSVGNVYYPHTDASVVKYGETTVGASLSEKASIYIAETLPTIADRKEKTMYLKITDTINSNTSDLKVSPTMGIKII